MSAITKSFSSIFLTLILICVGFATPVQAVNAGSDDSSDKTIEVQSFVTWWSHDAVGYHPAIVFIYENVGSKDLSGLTIRFQARFTDLRNGYVTVARKEVHEDELIAHQDKYLLLRGPSSFELPIDPANWPQMECKVMCRVGDVDDSGTENLILARLESIVMTDEEAQNSAAMHVLPNTKKHRKTARAAETHITDAPPPPLKALSATQQSLNGPKESKPVPHVETVHKTGLDRFLAQTRIAGLGDNFLQFEETYKQQPTQAEVNTSTHFKWIRYTHENPALTVFNGTKTSSADVLVIQVRAEEIQSEGQLAQLVKAMSGKFKGEPVEKFKKSVSYRSNGQRVEMCTLDANGYHAIYFNPSKEGGNGNYIVVLSRLPGNPKVVLPDLFRKTQVLNFLTPLFGDPEQD